MPVSTAPYSTWKTLRWIKMIHMGVADENMAGLEKIPWAEAVQIAQIEEQGLFAEESGTNNPGSSKGPSIN
jgi:hypothetical protein